LRGRLESRITSGAPLMMTPIVLTNIRLGWKWLSVTKEQAHKISAMIQNIIQFWPCLIFANKTREQNYFRSSTHGVPIVLANILKRLSVTKEQADKISAMVKNIIQFWPSLKFANKTREQNHLGSSTHDEPNCTHKYQTRLEDACSNKLLYLY